MNLLGRISLSVLSICQSFASQGCLPARAFTYRFGDCIIRRSSTHAIFEAAQ